MVIVDAEICKRFSTASVERSEGITVRGRRSRSD